MAKITIADILTNFASSVSINARFQQIEDEFNNNVLYRNNPIGEPNVLSNDIDMGGNDILNLGNLLGSTTIGATNVVVNPAGNISSVDVQNALEEIDTEKAKVAGDALQDFSVNNLTVAGTVDGRDVATDGTKLDGVEASADVTDAVNVNAAGALMHTDVVPTDGVILKTGVETYTVIKHNSTATTDPSGTDNFAAGYAINSLWANVSPAAEKSFLCVGDGLWIEAGSAVASAITSISGTFPVAIGGTATVPDVSTPHSGAVALSTSGASVTASTPTILNWDAEEYDTGSIHDIAVNTSRFVIPAGASYAQFNGLIQFIGSTTADIRVRADGNPGSIRGSSAITAATSSHAYTTAWLDLTGFTYLEINITIGTTRNLDSSGVQNYMGVSFK